MKLRLLVLICGLFSLTSCFDIVETFNIKEDGSGNYEAKTDMSNALSMLSMMGAGAKETEKIPQKFDTTFSFKGMLDTVTTLTAEEKAAISKMSGKMHLDQDKGEMIMVMNMPFRDAKEYNLMQAAFKKFNELEKSPMEGVFKGAMGGGDNGMGAGNEPGGKKGGGLPGIMPSNVEISMTANSLSRRITKQDQPTTPTPGMEDMPEEMKDMFKVNYTTIINLPRPVKNLKGEGKVSDDKKQVKQSKKIDLSSGFTPADFDFTIEF